MRVRLKLKPGQRGTKRLTEKFGDSLFCVRYRYDEKTRKRYTTVELIVDQADWPASGFKPEITAHLKIDFNEFDLREKIRKAGGRWNSSTKTWEIPYKTACTLGLKKRITGYE